MPSGRKQLETKPMKIEKSTAQAQRPARKTLTLFKQLPAAEALRARSVAYEAALAVIG